MCTVTVIPMPDGGVRLVSNRDEERTRPAAVPPERRLLRGGLVAGWPTDPHAGGTWIVASSRGLCISVLNVNPPTPVRAGPDTLSRGMIIPTLVDSLSPGAVLERLDRSPLERFRPFRVVAADAVEIGEFVWDGRSSTADRQELSARCFVSSGLGDHLVGQRLELWSDWLNEHGISPEAQDAFHEHRWDDRPHLSVRMEREDARTVSVTAVLATGAGGVTIQHRDDAGAHELVIAGVVATRPTMFTSRAAGDPA